MCLIDNLEAIAFGSELCNRYGLDTITTGCVIAFTMELFEKGILTKEETGGIEARFGNAQAMIDLIRLIGERKGIGQLLGEGVRAAAEKIGGLAKDYAFHVKVLEIPAHDPRAFTGLALSYLPNLEVMLSEYYALRGWSKEGIPEHSRLAELGLA